MNIFLVNKDDPASKGLCKKLSGPKNPGEIIPLTMDEMDLYNSVDFQQISGNNENKSILTEVEPGKSYIVTCDRNTNIDDFIHIEKRLGIHLGLVRVFE